MTFSAFVHLTPNRPTTLSELKRIYDWVAPDDHLGMYAYATQSGVAAFELIFGESFWADTQSRWLFGIDYGRTQPNAIRSLCEKPNVEVRIHDGTTVVSSKGFLPRRDFHMKSSLLVNQEQQRLGLVVGSGNFSSNGLRKSVEAGTSVQLDTDDPRESVAEAVTVADELWDAATPADEIIDSYEEAWSGSYFRHVADDGAADNDAVDDAEIFWIEAGYVTKNRGPLRPGNQIDFPRGMSRYFGFNPPDDLPRNSVIGNVTFSPPLGGDVSQNLRLGNNLMEKISLPIPETHGFDIYDGKILVFQREEGRFVMRALETDDFETAYGDKLSGVQVMGSGRRFGHIVE